MISNIKKELQKRESDNRGAALVLVIVAVAFVGMLVAMILYMAYCNYLMKSNDRLAKDNFYTAEYALDVINAGLQMDVSECMSEAYVKTLNNSSGKDSVTMEFEFKEEFIKKIKTKLQYRESTPGAPDVVYDDRWDISHLTDFWTKNGIAVQTTPGLLGACLDVDMSNDENVFEIAANKQYVTLYNVRIVYTDEKGFVSIIRTDIRIKVPSIGFAQSASKMNIENFSLVANKSLINDNHNSDPAPATLTKGSDVAISGNVFGGYNGVVVENANRIRFITDPTDAAAGSTLTYNLIADSLNVGNSSSTASGLEVDSKFNTYVDNINVESGKLTLNGMSFVGDDLSIGGKDSTVRVSGEYTGYGNTLGQADGSSSVLINGGNTTIDFGGLEKLALSGHAYVGATKYDADADRLAHGKDVDKSALTNDKIENEEEYDKKINNTTDPFLPTDTTIPENELDFMMGEAISVKANQLLYMVPADCVGYKVSTGEQVVAKNPMTYEEYKMLSETEEPKLDADGNEIIEDGQPVKQKVYEPVRLDKLWAKLGGVAYTNDYKAVYRRVNGTVLVYLYLDFGVSETMANEFYKAYYEYDKEGIDRYVNAYIKEMTWNSALNSNLTLAGNAFYLNSSDEVVFLDDDLLDPNKYGSMLRNQTEYTNTYTALMHSLSTDYDSLTSTQQSNEIFDSLVDKNALASLDGLQFKNASDDIYARVINGDVIYPSAACPANTKMIVAAGNIFLTDDFKGVAIAGKNIYVCNGCNNINYSPSEVLQALRTKATNAAGKEVHAYEIFGASGEITYGVTGEETEEEKISLNDLIVYQNWKKE